MAENPKVLRIFVGGVAALVPRGPGKMTVLLPEVDSAKWKDRGYMIHNHDAFLAYHYQQWELVVSTGSCPVLPADDLRYLSLVKTLLELKVDDDGEGIWEPSAITRWLPRDASDCTHRHWVAPMLSVDSAYADVNADLLKPAAKSPVHDLLQARAELIVDRGYSWRLNGEIKDANYIIKQYEFKLSPNEAGRFSQALAAVVAFDCFLGKGESPEIQLSGTCNATLRIKDGVSWDDPVELLIVQLMPDPKHGEVMMKGRDGIDAHFRTYYDLSAAKPPDEWLKVPFEVPKEQRILRAVHVAEAAKGIFFDDAKDAKVAPGLKVPEDYQGAFKNGPPLCPQAVFNQNEHVGLR